MPREKKTKRVITAPPSKKQEKAREDFAKIAEKAKAYVAEHGGKYRDVFKKMLKDFYKE